MKPLKNFKLSMDTERERERERESQRVRDGATQLAPKGNVAAVTESSVTFPFCATLRLICCKIWRLT
jgi:hypothetical protein